MKRYLLLPLAAAMLFSTSSFAEAERVKEIAPAHEANIQESVKDCGHLHGSREDGSKRHHDHKHHRAAKKMMAMQKEKRELVMKYIEKLPEAEQEQFKEEMKALMEKNKASFKSMKNKHEKKQRDKADCDDKVHHRS